MNNPFVNFQTQLEMAAKYLKVRPDILEILKWPQRVIELYLAVKMDNGEIKLFRGFRSQHNNFRGPYKGGIRFHPQVTKEEVIALSAWMSLKCAVAGIPFGGGKGGVIVNPKELSPGELERLSRAYAAALTPFIGPYVDVPAPDVNTDSQIMAWMVDEYRKQLKAQSFDYAQDFQSFDKLRIDLFEFLESERPRSRRPELFESELFESEPQSRGPQSRGPQSRRPERSRTGQSLKLKANEILATFTGKPLEKGGSLGRTEATGRSGVYVLQELLAKLKNSKSQISNSKQIQTPKFRKIKQKNLEFGAWSLEFPQPITVAVQGMGNVGYYFAKLAQEKGFKVVGVSDSVGGIILRQHTGTKPLDLEKVMVWKKKTGSVVGFPGTRTITNEELLELPVDVLVPSALENVISKTNAGKIKAKIIIEMANGPVTPEADEVLNKRGILSVPDILANSGGVTVSYFEWVQNLRNEKWSEEKVNFELEKKIIQAFDDTWQIKGKQQVDFRTAAYILAIDRILRKV